EDVHTYLKPLQASEGEEGLRLFAPNSYTLDTVRERFMARIRAVLEYQNHGPVAISLEVGARSTVAKPAASRNKKATVAAAASEPFEHNLDPNYTFESFVEGKTNELGKAAAMQVATNPGHAFNPLLLYG